MDCNKVGKLIADLRKERNMTQKDLADMMHLSDRTISKWECGSGCPDISLLPELSDILEINIEKILEGDLSPNERNGGNMKRVKFYVCPDCGNILYSTGEADISCCGRKLKALTAQKETDMHKFSVEDMDNQTYLSFNHEMTKSHFISFVAHISYDSVHMVKLYSEQSPEVHMPMIRKGELYYYCSEHGLFKKKL